MTAFKCAVVLLVLSGLNAESGRAEESVNGRWAVNPASCDGFGGSGAQSPLVVTSYAVRWSGDSCRIGRMYKTGETVHIQALCWGETGEKSIPVSLHQQAGRLSVTWDRGALGVMHRCQ